MCGRLSSPLLMVDAPVADCSAVSTVTTLTVCSAMCARLGERQPSRADLAVSLARCAAARRSASGTASARCGRSGRRARRCRSRDCTVAPLAGSTTSRGRGQLSAASQAILRPSRSRCVAELAVMPARPWTGSWTGIPVESRAMSVMDDEGRAVRAAGDSVA